MLPRPQTTLDHRDPNSSVLQFTRHAYAGCFTNTGAVHKNQLSIWKLFGASGQRIGIQSSGSCDTSRPGIKVAVAPHVVDTSTSRPLPRRLRRYREGNGA